MNDVAAAFDRRWAELAPIGRHGTTGGYRRFAWTAEDAELAAWFAAEAGRLGLALSEDRAGNQWAWWGHPDDAVRRDRPGVATGSHLDSVPDGGPFDGALGVASALGAVEALQSRGYTPARPLGVVRFVEEEGARFGVACLGSRVVTGAMPARRALGLRDAAGTSLAEAITSSGRRPELLAADEAAVRRLAAFVELHVEQGRAGGPGLADLGRPVGVGTGIWPHGRWRLDFPGEANHAGTTAMDDRHDAMVGCATAVLAAAGAARRHGAVATVGRVRVLPGGVNAIPVAATAWLDVRAPAAGSARRVLADVEAASRPFDATLTEESWTDSTSFDTALTDRVAAVLGDPPRLATGAGHDAGVLAAAGVPSAMIFVRNPTGVSHSPAEHAGRADCLAGVRALTDVLAELCAA